MPAHSSNLGVDWLDFGIQSFSSNIKGTTGDDLLTGDNSGNIFTGRGGNDTMIGGAGDDLFRDGPGQDSVVGGGGFDRLSFGFYTDATQGAFVNLMTGVVHDGYGHTEQVTGISAVGFGTLFPDTFIGGATPDFFWGGKGDILIGGLADNVFAVNDAPALVVGGGGVNTVFFQGGRFLPALPGDTQFEQEAATQGVTIDLGRQLIVNDGFGGSGLVFNIQNVVGSPQDDVIVGDHGDNVLSGVGGNDTLTGGGGSDVFLFDAHALDWNSNPIANGQDVITDFHHSDRIAINVPGVSSFADLTISHDAHNDVVITFGASHDSITLLHVHDVSAADFVFGSV
jgi:Ca2+-binding RTX toxin-like protein